MADTRFKVAAVQAVPVFMDLSGSVEKTIALIGSAADNGASLVGEEVVLSQLSEASHHDAECIQFSLIADHDDDVSLSLQLDFLDDGTADYSHPLVADDWQRVDS